MENLWEQAPKDLNRIAKMCTFVDLYIESPRVSPVFIYIHCIYKYNWNFGRFYVIHTFFCKLSHKSVRWTCTNQLWLWVRCLTPLSAIFQLYHGGQFYWWSTRRKPPTCHNSLTNFITYCCIECKLQINYILYHNQHNIHTLKLKCMSLLF